MSITDAAIQSKITEFVAELHALVREAAMAAVSAALSGHASPSRKTSVPHATSARPTKRVRRSEAQLVADVARVLAHVKAHRGTTAIEIGKALNLTTDKLAGPMQRLLAKKQVRREGEKSATRYFAT